MTERKNPMPALRRRAHHEAGHAVAAAHHGIAVDRLSLPTTGHDAVSHFQPLAEFCRLQPGQPVDLVKLDEYVVFLMAGSVAEMLAVEQYHGLVPRSKAWRRFRIQCFEMVWSNPELHLDLAFYCLAAWTPVRMVCDLYTARRDLWDRTCRLIQPQETWQRIERVAGQLLLIGDLDATAVATALGCDQNG